MTDIRNQNLALFVLGQVFQYHTTMWTEDAWEVVSARESPTKFLLTDEPVTFYNAGAFPAGTGSDMALSIKSDEADKLAREVTRLTGESISEAVTNSLRERLERERRPVLIVEVESPATVRHDRGVKVDRYRQVPSVREILLVSSEERRVQVWRRESARWTVEDVIGDAALRLESCDLEIPLAQIYAGL